MRFILCEKNASLLFYQFEFQMLTKIEKLKDKQEGSFNIDGKDKLEALKIFK